MPSTDFDKLLYTISHHGPFDLKDSIVPHLHATKDKDVTAFDAPEVASPEPVCG